MTTKWYYVTPQKTHQEFTEADVQGLLSSNTIAADTLIWNTTMADWKPAAEVKPDWFASAGSAEAAPVTTTAPATTITTPGNPTQGTAVASTTAPPPMSSANVATDPMAMASMISGIVALAITFLGCFIFPCLSFLGVAIAFPAVVTGHMALNNIKVGSTGPEGRGMAIAGLIMGYVTLASLLLLVLLGVLGFGFAAAFSGSGIPSPQ